MIVTRRGRRECLSVGVGPRRTCWHAWNGRFVLPSCRSAAHAQHRGQRCCHLCRSLVTVLGFLGHHLAHRRCYLNPYVGSQTLDGVRLVRLVLEEFLCAAAIWEGYLTR